MLLECKNKERPIFNTKESRFKISLAGINCIQTVNWWAVSTYMLAKSTHSQIIPLDCCLRSN